MTEHYAQKNMCSNEMKIPNPVAEPFQRIRNSARAEIILENGGKIGQEPKSRNSRNKFQIVGQLEALKITNFFINLFRHGIDFFGMIKK